MEEIGQIRELKGKRAIVEIRKTSLCGSCGKKGGCNLFTTEAKNLIEAHNPIGAQEGDWVRLDCPERKGLLSSLLLFGTPVFSLFFGILISRLIAQGQEFIGGLFGLISSFLGLKFLNNHLRRRGSLLPTITSPIEPPPDEENLEGR